MIRRSRCLDARARQNPEMSALVQKRTFALLCACLVAFTQPKRIGSFFFGANGLNFRNFSRNPPRCGAPGVPFCWKPGPRLLFLCCGPPGCRRLSVAGGPVRAIADVESPSDARYCARRTDAAPRRGHVPPPAGKSGTGRQQIVRPGPAGSQMRWTLVSTCRGDRPAG